MIIELGVMAHACGPPKKPARATQQDAASQQQTIIITIELTPHTPQCTVVSSLLIFSLISMSPPGGGRCYFPHVVANKPEAPRS